MSYSRIPEEEIVPRGQEIYERDVRPRLGPEHEGQFVVIDVESGDREISDDDGEAFERAEKKRPGAVFFVLRIGPDAAPVPPTASAQAGNPTPAPPEVPLPW